MSEGQQAHIDHHRLLSLLTPLPINVRSVSAATVQLKSNFSSQLNPIGLSWFFVYSVCH